LEYTVAVTEVVYLASVDVKKTWIWQSNRWQ